MSDTPERLRKDARRKLVKVNAVTAALVRVDLGLFGSTKRARELQERWLTEHDELMARADEMEESDD